MNNFSQAIEATNTAMEENSFGSAAKENAKYMEGLEAKVTALNAAFQQMSTAVVDSGLVKGVLDLLTGLAEFGATDAGSTIVQIALSLGTIVGLLGVVKAGKYLMAWTGFTAAIKTIGTFLLSSPLTAIVAAIAAGIKTYDLLTVTYKEQLDIIKEQEDELAAVQSQITELTAAGDGRSQVEQSTLNILLAQEDALKRQIALSKEEAFKKYVKETTEDTNFFFPMNWNAPVGTEMSQILFDLQDRITSLDTQLDSWFMSYDQKIVKTANVFSGIIADYKERYDIIKGYQEEFGDSSYWPDQWTEFIDFYEHISGRFNELNKMSVDGLEQIAEGVEDVGGAAEDATDAVTAFNDALESLGPEYDEGLNGYTKVFATFVEELEAGHIESKNMQAALTALGIDYSFLSDKMVDPIDKVNRLKEIQEAYKKVLSDTKDPAMAFLNFIDGLTKVSDSGVELDDIGNLAVDFEKLSETTGWTVKALKAGFDSLQLFGIEAGVLGKETDDLSSKIRGLGTGEDGGEAFSNIVTGLLEIKSAGQKASSGISDATSAAESFTAVENSANAAKDAIGEAMDKLAEFGSMVVTPTIQLQVSASGTGLTGLSGSNLGGAISSLLGGLSGSFASGTSNAPEGLSLVNEKGPEIIQSGDSAYIAGDGNPAIAYLNKGDMVFNAKETKDILNGSDAYSQLVNGGIMSHAQEKGNGQTYSTYQSFVHYANWASTLAAVKKTQSGTSSGSSSSSSSLSMDDFDSWLAEKKHALNMDLITEEEYYNELEKMYKKYLDAGVMDQEDAWSYEEEIYKYRKQALDDEAEAMEKINALAKAEATRLKVFSGGQWQYMGDYDAIASAVADMDETTLNKYMGIKNSDSNITVSSAGNNSYTFSIDSLSLPDVNDGSAFVSGLKQYALQYVYKNSNSNSTTRSKGRGK